MPTDAPTDLTQHLERLLNDRQAHTDALSRIDGALEQVRLALEGVGGVEGRRRPGRPRAAIVGPTAGPRRRRRGRRGSFATSADELILSVVRQRGGATTQEIKRRWKAEGRGGTADNALSKMTREGKLRRTPLQGQRGSRYTAA